MTAIFNLPAVLITIAVVYNVVHSSYGRAFISIRDDEIAAEAMGAVTHRFAAALSGTPGSTWLAATEDDVPGTAAYGVALLSRYDLFVFAAVGAVVLKPMSRW